MSCQSLTAPAFDDKEHSTFRRSVRFNSEARRRREERKDGTGYMSLTALTMNPMSSQQNASISHSAPTHSVFSDDVIPPAAACRFPKLEDCAHFHYERVSLGGVSIELTSSDEEDIETLSKEHPCDEGWITLKVRTHVASEDESRTLNASWTEASDVREWTLTRNAQNFLQLDDMLHRCIYDRKVSGLVNLSEEITASLLNDRLAYQRLMSHYVHHLSIIADDSINCGPVLNWFHMDNKGHKLLVASEDSSSINTPAVAAAYSVRKYVSQARDEISFEVGDMISIIDMPGPQESLWWRGKRGFRVGFFPHNCVAVIGDKVPRNMSQPPPIIGSVAVNQIKPVLRKHGKLISLFRSFILSRPSRRSLKQQGILRERVFGCDLGEHLLNCGRDVPEVLVQCAQVIESRGCVDGIYRLSGGSGLTQRLRAAFDEGICPDLHHVDVVRDVHALASLLKMYFRELPNPLCTYQLYDSFVSAVQSTPEEDRVMKMRDCVVKLPPPHYRTLSFLCLHLRRVALYCSQSGMTPRNLAIVWAPNLLRAPHAHHALMGVAVQAVITEFLICYAEELFSGDQEVASSIPVEEPQVELRGRDSYRRPKSLPINPPTKLLSLEEARRRDGESRLTQLSPISSSIPAPKVQLLPSASLTPNYIEVGSGPNNLPQYHTILELPSSAANKRGLKRSPSGWRGLFSRSKQQRHRVRTRDAQVEITKPVIEAPVPVSPISLRGVKSCESLQSDNDTLPPLVSKGSALQKHARSVSCDSYFEPWQHELNAMRLRLSPQERDYHIFSEEDDTQAQAQLNSSCSSPILSEVCSVEPSPNKNLKVDCASANEYAERKRNIIEEQLSQINYIDACESPRCKASAEKRTSELRNSPCTDDAAKRLCKDRDSSASVSSDGSSPVNVKLRERKPRPPNRHSGNLPTEPADKNVTRLTWHGREGHSTLIKINWPETPEKNSGTTTPVSVDTPNSPKYDILESNSDTDSENNKQTIRITQEKSDVDLSIMERSVDSLGISNLNCETKIETLSQSCDTIQRNETVKEKKEKNIKSQSTSNIDCTVKSHDYENSFISQGIEENRSSDRLSENIDSDYDYVSIPAQSPKLKSTISITFRSPTKDTSIYEDVVPKHEKIELETKIDHNSIELEAKIPEHEAVLPTQSATQPDDIYSKVKFFKRSIDEVNALIDTDKTPFYENIYITKPVKELANKFDTYKTEIRINKNETTFCRSDFDGDENLGNDVSSLEKDNVVNKDVAVNDNVATTNDNIATTSDFNAEFRLHPKQELSRERIEKYKEERRLFLREKYSSQSFRGTDGQIKVCEDVKATPRFERRNTFDLGQRMKFSLAKSSTEAKDDSSREEKVSPSYNIKNMAALFEQKSLNNG